MVQNLPPVLAAKGAKVTGKKPTKKLFGKKSMASCK